MPSYGSRRFNSRRLNTSPSRRPSRSRRAPQAIHPSRFIKAARPVEEVPFTPQHRFADFALAPLLHDNIVAKGFVTPSRIQDAAIPAGLEGKDIVGIANTGTGKTTAFALPVLQRLLTDPKACALIIAPTRELAEQIEAECATLAKGSGLNGALLIGGMPMPKQIRELNANPSLIIGTPGRIKDHFERGTLKLARCNIVVLDEVDRMVDMGFINDVRFLLGELAPERQSLFFSATLDKEVEPLVQGFMRDPVTISVRMSETSDNVEQSVVYYAARSDKFEKLHDLLNRPEVSKVLIFDETQIRVDRLARDLVHAGFKAVTLHGGKTQGQRQRALRDFKSGTSNILVATDVAARGIDIADITHVVNYSVPQTYDDYTHRIGRVGRAGRTGHAFTFISNE